VWSLAALAADALEAPDGPALLAAAALEAPEGPALLAVE